jgi:SAM-dependent methyltransferase
MRDGRGWEMTNLESCRGKGVLSGKQFYDNKYHQSKFKSILQDRFLYDLKTHNAGDYFPDFNYDKWSNHKILDYGCGYGQNTAQFPNKYAYDINKELYPFLKEQGFKVCAVLPDNFFDDILVSQVLEHLDNPMETLKMLNKKLKKGGMIRIVVPHVNYDIPKRLSQDDTDGHLQNWSCNELNNLLRRCGFKPVYNRIIYRRGTERLSWIAKHSYWLYRFLTTGFGQMVDEFDVFVIGEKI